MLLCEIKCKQYCLHAGFRAHSTILYTSPIFVRFVKSIKNITELVTRILSMFKFHCPLLLEYRVYKIFEQHICTH